MVPWRQNPALVFLNLGNIPEVGQRFCAYLRELSAWSRFCTECYFLKKPFKHMMDLCKGKQGHWSGKSSSITSLKTGPHLRCFWGESGTLFHLAHRVRAVPSFPRSALDLGVGTSKLIGFPYRLSRQFACNSSSCCSHARLCVLSNPFSAVRQSFAECSSGLYFLVPLFLCFGGRIFWYLCNPSWWGKKSGARKKGKYIS